MPIVNYVREHIRFMEYATDEHLTASERLLWYALMHVMNQRAQGNVWPDEFIRISNDRLLSYCPMKYDTMAAARNGLKQRGLIEYTKGEKNKVSPAYRVVYFYPQYAPPETEKDGDVYQKKSDYTGGNIGDNIGDNTGGNKGGNTGDYSINYTKGEPVPDVFEDDDNEEQAYARAREEAACAWKEQFGRAAPPAALNRLAFFCSFAEFEAGVLTMAVEMAAGTNAASPVEYTLKILDDWKKHGVRTGSDVGHYVYAQDAARGRIPGITAREGLETLRKFDETHKAVS